MNSPCDCHGLVGCNTSTGSIVSINLQDNSLQGTIPDLSALVALESINLDAGYSSSISGTLPATFSRLSNLRYFSMAGDSQVSGTLPAAYAALGRLGFLQLCDQDSDPWPLSGTLPPAYSSLGNLSSGDAFSFILGPMQLSGTIPASYGNWPELRSEFNLAGSFSDSLDAPGGSQISGTLPPALLRTFGSLDKFWLQNMPRLSGTLPTQSGLMSSVTSLMHSSLGISGTLPPSFGGMTSLQQWQLSYFPLSGTLPAALKTMTQLADLYMYGPARLSGTLPPEAFVGWAGSIDQLDIQDSRISGTLPDEFGRLTALEAVVLQNIPLSGTLAPSIGGLSSMTDFELTLDGLSGTIPPAIRQWDQQDMTSMTISGNAMMRVSGTLPTQVGLFSQLTDFTLALAPAVSGTLPLEFWQLTAMQTLEVTATALSGTISGLMGKMSDMDSVVIGFGTFHNDATKVVDRCRISGTLPPELTGMDQLRLYLQLDGPISISGTLPAEFSEFSNLQQIEIEAPALSGTLPPSLSKMPMMDTLTLTRTALTGTLPPEFSGFGPQGLTSLYIDKSHISGTLPYEWGRLSTLHRLSVTPWAQEGGRCLSGSIPSEWGALSLRTFSVGNASLSGEFSFAKLLPGWSGIDTLDLSNNNMSGSPLEATDGLDGSLETLKLHGNNFTGGIDASFPQNFPALQDLLLQDQAGAGFDGFLPSGVGGMSRLQNLVAVGNSFSGTLPSLAGMADLQVLALAGNRLSGSLPPDMVNVPYLTSLLLGMNRLTGEIPAGLASNPVLAHLDVSRNEIAGTVPPFAAEHRLGSLRLSLNRISGTISQNLLAMPDLRELHLDRNDLSCELPLIPGSPILPAMPNVTSSDLSILAGNLINCPVPEDVVGRDEWAKSYVCGWARLVGHGGTTKLTSPSGMGTIALGLFLVGATVHRCRRGHRRAPSPASEASESVRREVERFDDFHRTSRLVCVFLSLIATALGALYWHMDSPMSCRYEKKPTAAFAAGGVSPALLAVLWLALQACLVCWGVLPHTKRRQRDDSTSRQPTLVIVRGHANAPLGVPSAPIRADASLYTILAFPTANASQAYEPPAGASFSRVKSAAPAALNWGNALSRASTTRRTSGRARGRHSPWRKAALLVGDIVVGLIVGATPNIFYVLIESRVISFSDQNVTSLVVMLIALAKSLLGSQVVPALSILAADLMVPLTLHSRTGIRMAVTSSLTLFNALCWPILAALTLNPSCFRDAIVPPTPEPLHYTTNVCYIMCDDPDSPQCPNAGHIHGCKVVIGEDFSSVIQPEYRFNRQCASIAVSIYGPIYLLMFSYAIIAAAVWLLQNSSPPKPPPAVPPKPGLVARLLKRLAPKPKKPKKPPPPPTLGLTKLYVTTAQHVSIIASFGAVYPAVALLGTLKICIDTYVVPRQIEAAVAKHGDGLTVEGVAGLPSATVAASLAFQTVLLFMVFGPFGLIQVPAAALMVAVAALVALPAVWIGRMCCTPKAAKAAPRDSADRVEASASRGEAVNCSLVPSSIGESSSPEGGEAEAVHGIDDYVTAFEVWWAKEKRVGRGDLEAQGAMGPWSRGNISYTTRD